MCSSGKQTYICNFRRFGLGFETKLEIVPFSRAILLCAVSVVVDGLRSKCYTNALWEGRQSTTCIQPLYCNIGIRHQMLAMHCMSRNHSSFPFQPLQRMRWHPCLHVMLYGLSLLILAHNPGENERVVDADLPEGSPFSAAVIYIGSPMTAWMDRIRSLLREHWSLVQSPIPILCSFWMRESKATCKRM